MCDAISEMKGIIIFYYDLVVASRLDFKVIYLLFITLLRHDHF